MSVMRVLRRLRIIICDEQIIYSRRGSDLSKSLGRVVLGERSPDGGTAARGQATTNRRGALTRPYNRSPIKVNVLYIRARY